MSSDPQLRVSLTRTVGFHATHRYWVAEWSAAANQAKFAGATEPHPHDYRCAVTVTGAFDPETDMVVDLPALDRILQEEVVARFHQKQLDRDTPEFAAAGLLPSCEALALCLPADCGAAPRRRDSRAGAARRRRDSGGGVYGGDQ